MKEIHLFDLPEELYVKLDSNYNKFLFKIAYKKAGNGRKLLGIVLETMYGWKTSRNKVPIKIIKQLALILKVKHEIERNVESINSTKGSIKNPKFPITVSKDLGLILACMLGDGGISKRFEMHYTNNKDSLINTFLLAVKNVFGNVEVISDIKSGNKKCVWLPSVLGRILVQVFGIPKGDKTLIDYTIPKIILQSNNIIIASFLRRLFDDEGFVEAVGSGSRTIRIVSSIQSDKRVEDIPHRISDIINLLKRFDIRCPKLE